MQQIDLHTHHLKNVDSIQVLNVFAQDFSGYKSDSFFSIGLHPWHIGTVDPETCLQAIEQAAQQKNMLAIGECGLDRIVPVDFALQKQYFCTQIRIAEKYSKPLIIHCVRAYSDVLQIKKDTKSELPWIIHGYHGNKETTQSLIRHGFYFSVGESLLQDQFKQNTLRMIPTDRLFLETDERTIPIATIYRQAAQILKVDEEKLTELIYSNFKIMFGKDIGDA
jgi:TatD DNase family protein